MHSLTVILFYLFTSRSFIHFNPLLIFHVINNSCTFRNAFCPYSISAFTRQASIIAPYVCIQLASSSSYISENAAGARKDFVRTRAVGSFHLSFLCSSFLLCFNCCYLSPSVNTACIISSIILSQIRFLFFSRTLDHSLPSATYSLIHYSSCAHVFTALSYSIYSFIHSFSN